MPAERCLVGIRTPGGSLVKGLDVRIKKGGEVYVNYPDSSHTSYHASGQKHTKVGRDYVMWDGGKSGEFERMIFHRTPTQHILNRASAGLVGWEVSDLDSGLLPKLVSADAVIPAQRLQAGEYLGA